MKNIYIPGETVTKKTEYIKGHNIYIQDERLIASVYGNPKLINKLLTIEPKNIITYNTPFIGDIVICRVVEIQSKRWKLDGNSPLSFYLQLGAIELPIIIKRRKMEEDQIKMTEFFSVGDIVLAEVQKVTNRVINVHTRSIRTKKLTKGILYVFKPCLIKSLTGKFININGIEIIIAHNHVIWLGSLKVDDRVLNLVEYLDHCKNDNIKVNFETLSNMCK